MGGRALAVVSELDLIESSTGDRPEACPWWAFHVPDVQEVLKAHDWWESGQLREWWGDDPPYWLVLAVRYYHRQLEIVRAESYRLDAEERKRKAPRARLPPGYEVEHEIRG